MWRSPFVRLTAYYALVTSVGTTLGLIIPEFTDIFSGDRLRQLASRGLMGAPEVGIEEVARSPLEPMVMAFFAMLGSLVLLAPVVQIYGVARRGESYDVSVVQTLMILPIPVIALVIVVQDSIALAFSLAGIVAAVRFRNTLQDTKDAVYIFLAIGVALAAGVQALGIAAVATIMFNYLVLFMRRFRIGHPNGQPMKPFGPKAKGRAPSHSIGEANNHERPDA